MKSAAATTPRPRWLSTSAAAEFLGVVPRTVYGIVNRGELRAYKIGRVMRIREADIETYLSTKEVLPGDLDHLLRQADTTDRPTDGTN